MKTKQELTINNAGNAPKKAVVEDNKKTVISKLLDSHDGNIGDIKRFVTAVVIATVLYHIGIELMPVAMVYFWKNFWTVVMVLLFLAIYKAVQKTEPVIGKAVFLALIFWFGYYTISYYGGGRNSKTVDNTEQNIYNDADQILQNKTDSLRIIRSDIESKAMILPIGTHRFNLSNNDSTGWLTIPATGKYEYSISSKEYNYKIVYSDGMQFKGTKHGTIPWRARPVFQVKSLGDDSIKIQIKKIN